MSLLQFLTSCPKSAGSISRDLVAQSQTSQLRWNPDPILLKLPLAHWPVTWYGALFAIGLGLSYWLFFHLWREFALAGPSDEKPEIWPERLFTWLFVGMIAGARLGEVLFYEWAHYRLHLWEILQIWRGGLSSHGALLGILAGVWGFGRWHSRDPKWRALNLSYLQLLDLLALTISPCLAFIRLGNFLNQEIVGLPTAAAWGVVFLTPRDGSAVLPRHPVQLYEAAAYSLIGASLWCGKKSLLRRKGVATGAFLVTALTARMGLENYKAPVGLRHTLFHCNTGQTLSLLPLLWGAGLLMWSLKRGSSQG